jgi:hypothetical protein
MKKKHPPVKFNAAKQRKVVGKPGKCCVIESTNRIYRRKQGKNVDC